MPGNPFTAERRERLQADVTEFLAQFSKTYGAMFGVTTLEKVEAEFDEKKKDPRTLSYRKWNKVARGEFFKGECFAKTGAGSGGFKSWKKVYLVERQDYNIDVYGSKEEYDKKKKAKTTIRVAGYEVVRDVAKHLKHELHDLAGGLGLNEESVNSLTMFSPYAWGLAHPWRPNYVFQLHKSSAKEPTCGCIGGGSVVEPADSGKAEAKDRDKFIKFMERCANNSSPRDLKAITGKAFQKAVGKMCDDNVRLHNFRDDGTESEILVDMLLEQCFTPMRDDILNDLVGPVKMRIAAWYKLRSVLQTTVLGICEPAWTKMQDGVDKLMAKVQERVKQGAKPIVDLKTEVKNKVKEAIKSNTSDKLATLVEPHVGPILKGLENPLKEAFEKQREIYVKEVPQISTLPDDKTQRNAKLDAIPRTRSIVDDMLRATEQLIKPLLNLKQVNKEVFGNLDPHKYRSKAETTLLETLDAAMNSLEKKIDKDGKQDSVKDEVLKDFDHDAVLARRKFLQVVITDLLLGNVKRALSVVTQPILDGMNNLIPEDMQEFMDIYVLYDDTIDLIVGGTIEKVVNETIPKD